METWYFCQVMLTKIKLKFILLLDLLFLSSHAHWTSAKNFQKAFGLVGWFSNHPFFLVYRWLLFFQAVWPGRHFRRCIRVFLNSLPTKPSLKRKTRMSYLALTSLNSRWFLVLAHLAFFAKAVIARQRLMFVLTSPAWVEPFDNNKFVLNKTWICSLNN